MHKGVHNKHSSFIQTDTPPDRVTFARQWHGTLGAGPVQPNTETAPSPSATSPTKAVVFKTPIYYCSVNI